MSRISVFGLGYVGTVCSACLAKEGHRVIAVDINTQKVDIVRGGRSPIIEKDLEQLIAEGVESGALTATTDSREAVLESDLSFICVGSPSHGNGSLDTSYLERVSGDIGTALKDKDRYHVVVVRSTVLPGTVGNTVIPILERTSHKKAGVEFGVAMNPEFMRESDSVYDFYNPPKTVIGALHAPDADAIAELFEGVSAPLIRTSIEIAEMVKYVDNAFHALKVVFANEIGSICDALRIDAHIVMSIFCMDTKLNISPCYLKPGFAFGGSCLPKDIRALTYKAKRLDVNTPVLNAILPSNQHQIAIGLQRITAMQRRKIGILGLSFKAGTDDIRESPLVELTESLIGKGYDVRIYDRGISLARLCGGNKEYVERKIPHIARLMVSRIRDVLDHAEIVVIGNKAPEFRDVADLLRPGQELVDLVGLAERSTEEAYAGLSA
ncbi:MAG: nucleotide sugar dehydrogenase [Sedimentisphaerales bacterium]|nr:nucleotide sugar dehydrogenase [Sedimentisphaerales bacterium]